MALLDLSAAFDTLDHSILPKRLETTYGVRGTVLDWFVSYLSGRSQSVIVDGVVSANIPLVYGMPQGSVLGPVLFTLYSQLLSDVVSVHNCDYHKYSDDTELSKSAPPDQFTIISRLDYCYSVFTGLPADQIARLQRVLNSAARLVMKKRRRDHVTPLLKELRWLSVKFRCHYKIATLAYRHFEGTLPPYLSSSLCAYGPSRSLRSSNAMLLKIPKRKLNSFVQRSFSFMAPSLWNSLPATLRNIQTFSQFKSHLKTFLFAQALQ